MTRYFMPLCIALLGAACTTDTGMRAWYYTYMSNVREYDSISREVATLAEGYKMSNDSAVVLSNSLIALIDSIEIELLRASEQEDLRIRPVNSPGDMSKLADFSVSTALLIGPDETKPLTTPLSAFTLKARIEDHIRRMAASAHDPEVHLCYRTILNTKDGRAGEHGIQVPWSINEFFHLPLICVLNKLNAIKIKVRTVEMYAIMERTLVHEDATNAPQ